MTLSGHRSRNRSVFPSGAPSQCEMVTGQGFPSPYQPDKGRSAIYRTDLGPDSCWYALCAAIVGNRGKPSGEPRIKPRPLSRRGGPAHAAPAPQTTCRRAWPPFRARSAPGRRSLGSLCSRCCPRFFGVREGPGNSGISPGPSRGTPGKRPLCGPRPHYKKTQKNVPPYPIRGMRRRSALVDNARHGIR